MVTRLAAFIVWALVAGGAVYWSLKLLVRAPGAPVHSVAAVGSTAVRGDLTRLLGSAPVASATAAVVPVAASRFRLHGVMAPKGNAVAEPSRQGVALISVDGKPPRAYAVGARLDSDLVLQAVSLRTASIGAALGGPGLKLEVPPMPMPSTGKLLALGAAPPTLSAVPAGPSVPRPTLPATLPTPSTTPAIDSPAARPANTVPPRRDPASSR